jgi:hypothetical protein
VKQKIIWGIGALMVLAAGLCLLQEGFFKPGIEKIIHTGPTLEKIQELEVLVTQRVVVSDIVEARMIGRTGGIRAVVIVQGDVTLGVDLSQARIVSRDDAGKQMYLELPRPEASSPRVNHEKTRIYSIERSGLWILVPSGAAHAAIADLAFKDAQAVIMKAGSGTSLINQSLERTQTIIETFGLELSWRIDVRWREPEASSATPAVPLEQDTILCDCCVHF